jgi:medium-chain acyl-[acyl-carrier-protein] hydrolase
MHITRPVATRLRLFCFPFAGALPNYFRQFADRIPADIELWALQLPGRGARAREPLLHDMHAIITPLVRAISPYLDLPFAFFGHSMGAAVSFALARRLRDQGLPLPLHMIVSGCRPVHLERPLPCVHRMNLDELTEELRILGGTPEAVLQDDELLQFYAPTIRADFEVLESYVPGHIEPLPVAVSIWAGTHDPRVAVDTVTAWGELFSGERREIHFPGGHMFIDSGQCQSQCLDELERVLARCTDHPAHHQHQRRTGT